MIYNPLSPPNQSQKLDPDTVFPHETEEQIRYRAQQEILLDFDEGRINADEAERLLLALDYVNLISSV